MHTSKSGCGRNSAPDSVNQLNQFYNVSNQ
nr:MAG TPA: hypothetical protein [Caudoviricetes sp.]